MIFRRFRWSIAAVRKVYDIESFLKSVQFLAWEVISPCSAQIFDIRAEILCTNNSHTCKRRQNSVQLFSVFDLSLIDSYSKIRFTITIKSTVSLYYIRYPFYSGCDCESMKIRPTAY